MESAAITCSIGDLGNTVKGIADDVVKVQLHLNRVGGDDGDVNTAHRYTYAAQDRVLKAEQYEHQAASCTSPEAAARLWQLADECRQQAHGLIERTGRLATESAGVLLECSDKSSANTAAIANTLAGTGRSEGTTAMALSATVPPAIQSIAARVQGGIDAMPTSAGTSEQFYQPLGAFYDAMCETTDAMRVITVVDSNLRDYASSI